MSLVRLHILFVLLIAACGGSPKPQLKVLGIEQSERAYEGRQIKLFVEVVNYARRPMRLQTLQYTFGPSGQGAKGEVALARTVDAGSAVVVEVPILVDADLMAGDHLELRGQLITEQDDIVRAYPVQADVADTSDGAAATVEASAD